jgi:multiple sugar transport system substrate-binding protein
MIEMGPWELPAAQATKGLHFGITYLPRRSASQAPSSPLGGEVWTIPATTPAREQTALAVIKWMQTPARIVQVDTLFGYLPAYTPATSAVVAANPLLKIFAAELPTSKARTAVLGTKYPQASEAIWKALQQALTGNETPQQALHTAQDTISAL